MTETPTAWYKAEEPESVMHTWLFSERVCIKTDYQTQNGI